MNISTVIARKAGLARRGLVPLGLLAATAASTLALGASPASAAEFTAADREPYVEATAPMLVGRDRVFASGPGEVVTEAIEYGGLLVGASPASSDEQQVNVIYVLERFDGAVWKVVDSALRVVEVKGFERTLVGRGVYTPPTQVTHLYRMTYHLGWYDKATGDALVSGVVDADGSGDSVCVTLRTECESTADGKLRM